MLLIKRIDIIWMIGLWSTSIVVNGLSDTCSDLAYLMCDDNAECIEKNGVFLKCECKDGLVGDGLKGDGNTNTGCGPGPCALDSNCGVNEFCNEAFLCKCKNGYAKGEGTICEDINECLGNPCHSKASCENTPGSFECTCRQQLGYVGNGINCSHTCSMDYDCGSNEKCIADVCVCKTGFILVNEECVDINECLENPCDPNAVCVNFDGGFQCTCENGYFGNGEVCSATPSNCNDIKLNKPKSVSGQYEVDPDGDGPLGVIQVECEMRSGFGITIIPLTDPKKKRVKNTRPTVEYEYEHDMPTIKTIIDGSGYCYQEMSFKAINGAVLMDGNDHWINGLGQTEENWGGATTHRACACGELGYCKNPDSLCNANGTTETVFDNGKIVNKSKLPVLEVKVVPGSGYGEVWIGPLMCAPKPFDIPIDCHDGKMNSYYDIQEDGPQWLDFDGPDGALPPVLAHCDMTSYPHVGITVIPNTFIGYQVPQQPGSFGIEYKIDTDSLNKLVEISSFCSQEAEYECTNSRLLNNGDKKGYFSDTRGEAKNFWPGGMGLDNQCSCGVTKTCASDQFGCNCDVKDGKTRKDFGKVVDKADLPIGTITLEEIGGISSGRYLVGPLKCSQIEFGIPATCNDYIDEGYTESSTYFIDPDGPQIQHIGDLPYFPVYCRFSGEPLYATTVVYHEWRESFSFINAWKNFFYAWVSVAQLTALTIKSVSCTQTVSFGCTNAPINVNGKARIKWLTKDERMFSYFAGDGTKIPSCTCGQFEPSTCVDGGECNCDAGGPIPRNDSGFIYKKLDLPIMNMSSEGYQSSSEMFVNVGPLECQEIFPNCAEMKLAEKFRLVSESKMENKDYIVDPDGPGGVEPFVVTCTGSETSLPVDPDPTDPTDGLPSEGVEKCYEFNYKSPSGEPVTPEQVQALVESSSYCAQSLTQTCINAPITDHAVFSTCDGEEQTGWSGSRGDDSCMCGVTGTCTGGPDTNCNCDNENGQRQEDTGTIVDKERLAVCKVCVKLNSTSSLPPDVEKLRRVMPTLSKLVCNKIPNGRGPSCQYWRDQGFVESGPMMIDVDGRGKEEPFPSYCVLIPYPPAGWTEIYPKKPEITVPPEGVDVTIEYYVLEMEFIVTLIQKSGYCTQEIWLECEDSSFSLTGSYGWYDRNNRRQAFWGGNIETNSGCAGGSCQCNKAGVQVDGGLIINDRLLPVTRVVLGSAPGNRKLKIGPIKCFNIYKDCEDIRKNNKRTNPLKNHTYAIDPDQGGIVPPFAVVCDFNTNKDIGITVVRIVKPDDRSVRDQIPPKTLVVPIYYDSVTYIQIQALAEISQYCHQGMQYVCYNSPLTFFNDPSAGYYTKFGGTQSPSFGVAGHSSTNGCACQITKTCPDENKCHCDRFGKMTVDYGNEIDRDSLPVTQLEFGGQKRQGSSAMYDISDVRCGPTPFDLPVDCQEVFERGLLSGEHLIWPSRELQPFLVYCDLKTLDEGGITVIGHDQESNSTVTYDEVVNVTYHGVGYPGVIALVQISLHCFQPFKYECKKTKLLSGSGYFYWEGMMDAPQTYIGSGRWNEDECNCGKDGYCGGSENKTTLANLLRPCNCDAADDEDRADAGIFNSTTRLPIKSYRFSSTGIPESMGAVTIGKLYCAQQDFDLDECKLGFHDCHVNAICINTFGSYECRCLNGYRGLGVPDVWANGRNCYDNDECAMNFCPWSAYCVNYPGTYECICKEGFDQIGKRRCRDIDECQLGTHNCHENARCINTPGSFECRCKRNYRGDGVNCEPLSMCACFGDPHCITSDSLLIDYQGDCQYIMSRDSCGDLSSTPTFEVFVTFTIREGMVSTRGNVSWVKEVRFKMYNYTIDLMQDNEVRINGIRQVYFKEDRISILRYGKYLRIYTDVGIELAWDGDEVVELYTPGQFRNKTCGLCGNYNNDPSDDLVVGPQCPADTGKITTSFDVFGDSWVVPEYADEFPQCTTGCTDPVEPEKCEGMELATAELLCLDIYNRNGMFRECLAVMENSYLDVLKQSCVYDACHVDGDTEDVVCEAASFLAHICRTQYGISVSEFRSEGFCKVKCGENMVYDLCGATNQKNCLDIVTGTQAVSFEGDCQEGCYCTEGYVLNGDVCVLPEECGCYYENQYYKVGDSTVNNACTERVVCLENNTMSTEDVECHENAFCGLQDGVYGCHCKDGYYGDGSKTCIEDPCSKDPCGDKEICVHNSTLDEGFSCQCRMGYIGDCGNCTEIDECKTATYDCPSKSICVNTVGSYRCQCLDGYVEFAGKCKDIDECEMAKLSKTSVCGNFSQCSNRIGTYECPCCAGYTRDEITKECVESTPETAPGPKCCICNTAICDTVGTVCGEDGVTYDSVRDMIISNCEKGLPPRKQTQIDYMGECSSSCANVNCSDYQHCVEANGVATCECDECTEDDLDNEKPVCSDKLVMYPNKCIFKKIQCMFDIETPIKDTVVPCESKGQGKPVTPWSEWGPCSVSCGKGVSTKTREAYGKLSPAQQEKYPLTAETDCYGPPCPGGPCDVETPCKNVAAMCVVDENGDKKCECPSCENQFDPVCGYLVGTAKGINERSYDSPCHVRRQACKLGAPDYEVMHKGPCGEKPLYCARVANTDFVHDKDDPSFVSDKKYDLFDCDGGCGRMKKFCCQPAEVEELTVPLSNGNTTRTTTIQLIKSCECEDVPEPTK
ncbi:hypothetical protein ACF0H5_011528 [Mactra antiquata]